MTKPPELPTEAPESERTIARKWRREQGVAEVGSLPRSALARRAAMAGIPLDVAIKFLGTMTNARPGEVPEDGTPATLAQELGIRQPVVSASRSIPDTAQAFSDLMASGRLISPPYDPWSLVVCVDESEALPPAVEAMAVNIAGHGYELEPLFPTRDETTGAELQPPPEAKDERAQLQLWIAGVSPELGLTGILELADRDCETIGWATLEALRDREGHTAALNHIPAYTIRLAPEDVPILVDHTIRHPETGELVTLQRWRRFRRFAQVKDGRTVWFKQYGDPRHVNWRTGEVRPVTTGAGGLVNYGAPWGQDEGNSLEATELIYVRRYHPATPYGVPLWIGGTPHARAGRAAAELLVDWFDNAPIGTKLAMVAGGRFKPGAIDALQDQIDQAGRGRENAWNVLGLEAETDTSRDPMDETRDQAPRVSLEDLSTEIPSELYHGRESMIDRAAIRVRSMFRLGGIYFGDSEAESNRAAADTARAIGEEQVFRPIRRQRWDHLFNGQILPSLGINYWRISWKGATTADDTEGLTGALASMVTGGGASPNALRRILAGLTDRPVELIAEDWADRPLALTLALLTAGLDPNKPLAELAAEVKVKADQAAADAKAALAAGGGPPGTGGPGGKVPGGKPTPEATARVAKALSDLTRLVELRDSLAESLTDAGLDHLGSVVSPETFGG